MKVKKNANRGINGSRKVKRKWPTKSEEKTRKASVTESWLNRESKWHV